MRTVGNNQGGAGPPYQGDLTGNGIPVPRDNFRWKARKVFAVKIERPYMVQLMGVRVSQSPQYRGMEQLAARQAHNLKVGGSNPPPAT